MNTNNPHAAVLALFEHVPSFGLQRQFDDNSEPYEVLGDFALTLTRWIIAGDHPDDLWKGLAFINRLFQTEEEELHELAAVAVLDVLADEDAVVQYVRPRLCAAAQGALDTILKHP